MSVLSRSRFCSGGLFMSSRGKSDAKRRRIKSAQGGLLFRATGDVWLGKSKMKSTSRVS